jgi:site-specific DNA recombinase
VITKTTNRHGSRYEYFFCVGRNQKRTPCTQKAIPIELVERHVEDKWRNVLLDPEYAELLSQILEQEISLHREQADRDLVRVREWVVVWWLWRGFGRRSWSR